MMTIDQKKEERKMWEKELIEVAVIYDTTCDDYFTRMMSRDFNPATLPPYCYVVETFPTKKEAEEFLKDVEPED
jgi:hypothetical protein